MVVIGYDLMGQIRRGASEASPQGDRVGGERLGDGLQLPVAGMGRGARVRDYDWPKDEPLTHGYG